MSFFEAAMSTHWALLPDRVQTLVDIADRVNGATPQMLEAYRAEAAERGERLRSRNGVGILDVTGPLFKRANLFVQVSGATSYAILRRDFQAALDDPAIKSIVLYVDSPGGEASGCDELAKAIYSARGQKPITAFVSGMACSRGYWIASAADRVVVSDLAVLGSIGVVLGVTDRRKADEKSGITNVEFVSSQSPGKRPDVATDEGKARVQQMVDDLAEVFIAAVARHRGTDVDTVIKNFGHGGVLIGAKAVAAGMADAVGDFEEILGPPRAQRTMFSVSVAETSAAEVSVAPAPHTSKSAPAAVQRHSRPKSVDELRQEKIAAGIRASWEKTYAELRGSTAGKPADRAPAEPSAAEVKAGWQDAFNNL